MTRQEKTRDTLTFKLARIMAVAIADLPRNHDDRDVLELWKATKGFGPSIKCDAFWLMDNEPGRFARYQEWHPRLRSLRNHPKLGPELFNLFH